MKKKKRDYTKIKSGRGFENSVELYSDTIPKSTPSRFFKIDVYGQDIDIYTYTGAVNWVVEKMDLDQWISKVKEGQHLSEDELQLLCECVSLRSSSLFLFFIFIR